MEKHFDAPRHCESLEIGQEELLARICGGGRRSAKRDGDGNTTENEGPNNNQDDGGRNLPDCVKKMVNWGGHCFHCGFNPVGKKHTSATCTKKEPGHKDNATWNSRMGGSAANKPANVQL